MGTKTIAHPDWSGRHPVIFLTMASLILFSLAPTLAAEPDSGAISGRVVNRTTNEMVSGLEVKLQTIQENQIALISTTTTAQDGNFRFSNLGTQPTSIYQVSAVYKDVDYNSGALNFHKDQTSLNVELAVFEPGANPEAISSNIAHTVIYARAGGLHILEFESLANSENKVYIPPSDKGEAGTFLLFLPKEADSISFISELTPSNTLRTGNGLAYAGPVKPGETQFAYSYRVPYGESNYIYSRPVSYPMASYSLLVQGNTLRVESSLLQAQEPVVINGEPFQMFSAQNLRPATNLMINISQAAVPGSAGSSSSFPLLASPIVIIAFPVILVSALIIFIFFLRKRKPAPVKVTSPAANQALEQLLQDLAKLDDSFESGEISAEDYQQLRAEKKGQLLKLVQSNP